MGFFSATASHTRQTVSELMSTASASRVELSMGRSLPRVSRTTALFSPMGYISGNREMPAFSGEICSASKAAFSFSTAPVCFPLMAIMPRWALVISITIFMPRISFSGSFSMARMLWSRMGSHSAALTMTVPPSVKGRFSLA